MALLLFATPALLAAAEGHGRLRGLEASASSADLEQLELASLTAGSSRASAVGTPTNAENVVTPERPTQTRISQ